MKTISEVIVGEKADIFAVIKLSKDKKTQNGNGKPYIDFVFEDLTGTIDGKFWDTTLESIAGYGDLSPGIVVKIRGLIGEWNGKKQITLERIRQIKESDGVSKDDFIKKAPISYEDMYQTIINVVESYENEDLKRISLAVLDKYKEELTFYPASLVVHHNIKAGLLYHTYCMLQIAIKLSELYPMNKELLFTGCIIHDLGKIEEIDSNQDGVAVDYTKEGKLLGHMIQGIKSIHDLSKELQIDKEVTLLLEHMIASHHSKPEFGAVKVPMFFEAELLHYIDMIDSRTYMYQTATENIEPNTFTERMFFLDNKQVYKHQLK
jgi:3'-5' exoribonuclease